MSRRVRTRDRPPRTLSSLAVQPRGRQGLLRALSSRPTPGQNLHVKLWYYDSQFTTEKSQLLGWHGCKFQLLRLVIYKECMDCRLYATELCSSTGLGRNYCVRSQALVCWKSKQSKRETGKRKGQRSCSADRGKTTCPLQDGNALLRRGQCNYPTVQQG